MKKVIVSEFVSLDGVFADPAWTFQFGSQEQETYKLEELLAADTLLFGRVTYQAFAQAWPAMTDQQGFAARMNGLPKYVVSTTLTEGSWNNTTIIRGNLAAEVRKLKERPGLDILVGGSGVLVEALRQLDLVDEYRLMVFPIVLGKGRRLFAEGAEQKLLKLGGVKTFASGVCVLSYLRA